VALDPEHRLIVSVVPGKRSPDHVRLLLEDFRRRTAGRIMNLMTSDEYPAYREMILEVYGQIITPEPTGRPGRPRRRINSHRQSCCMRQCIKSGRATEWSEWTPD